LAMEFSRFLGLPIPARANMTDIIEAVCGVAIDTSVSMVLVDEIHNMQLATRSGAEVSGTLKYLSEPVRTDTRHVRPRGDRPGAPGPVHRHQGKPDRRPVHPHPRAAVPAGRRVAGAG